MLIHAIIKLLKLCTSVELYDVNCYLFNVFCCIVLYDEDIFLLKYAWIVLLYSAYCSYILDLFIIFFRICSCFSIFIKVDYVLA